MKILIVDDDIEIAHFLKKSFEHECFVVDSCHDGEQGSYMARINDYDCIILDYHLPKKTGKIICEELRSAGKTMPICVLSVEADVELRTELINLGADDFMIKPFSFQELLARIRALLRRPREMHSEDYKVGNLCLNPGKHSCKLNNQDIHLTRKEFMLLELLMRNTGSVVSRSKIMEHVWDMNADPFSNTLETHILSLRKKLKCDGKQNLIKTCSGQGYKIDE